MSFNFILERLSYYLCHFDCDNRPRKKIPCNIDTNCKWGGWDRTNCFGDGKCHREWWRDCYYTDQHGKKMIIDHNECRKGLGGSNNKYENWSGDCGGVGCNQDDWIWRRMGTNG